MQIRIAGIERNSVVDGPGIRYTIFAQGCKHKCEGCQNLHTHDFDGGELMDIERITAEIKSDPLIQGVTFSGGEPFEQIEAFTALAEKLKGYNIICYTGYTFEELKDSESARNLLSKINTLVDGKFEKDLSNPHLQFMGSENQRVLHTEWSLKYNEAISKRF
jgi:anaerobic ribonucleoside-triphosphate reductase activating protein